MAIAKFSALAALIALSLSACGGGGGGSPPSTQALQTSIPKPVLIEAYGDSTQFGVTYMPVGQWPQNPYNAPYFLQSGLQARFGVGVMVTNEGVSGTSGGQLLQGIDGRHQPWAAQMAQSRAQIVEINHGINDAAIGQETLVDYKWTLEELVIIARNYGKAVVLVEPNPRCDNVGNPPGGIYPNGSAKLDTFIPVMRAVAQELNVPIVSNYDYIKSLPDWCSMEPDGVHPNAALYQIVADREAAVIGPIVKGLLGSAS